MEALREFLAVTQQLTLRGMDAGDTFDDLLASAMSELGELADCIQVEKGRKDRELKEDSKVESIDLAICAFAVYFAKGGKIEDIPAIGLSKLAKWQLTIERQEREP